MYRLTAKSTEKTNGRNAESGYSGIGIRCVDWVVKHVAQWTATA